MAACKAYGPRWARSLLRAIERGEAAANQQLIPARSVLIKQQNRFARIADTRARTRRLNFHQRDEAVDFGFLSARVRQARGPAAAPLRKAPAASNRLRRWPSSLR